MGCCGSKNENEEKGFHDTGGHHEKGRRKRATAKRKRAKRRRQPAPTRAEDGASDGSQQHAAPPTPELSSSGHRADAEQSVVTSEMRTSSGRVPNGKKKDNTGIDENLLSVVEDEKRKQSDVSVRSFGVVPVSNQTSVKLSKLTSKTSNEIDPNSSATSTGSTGNSAVNPLRPPRPNVLPFGGMKFHKVEKIRRWVDSSDQFDLLDPQNVLAQKTKEENAEQDRSARQLSSSTTDSIDSSVVSLTSGGPAASPNRSFGSSVTPQSASLHVHKTPPDRTL